MKMRKKFNAILSMALAVILSVSLVPVTIHAENHVITTAASEQAQLSAQIIAQGNRPNGLVGFEGNYTLEETEQLISVIVEFVHQPADLVKAIAEANGEAIDESTEELNRLVQQDKDEFFKLLEGVNYSVEYEYDSTMNGVSIQIPESFVDDIANLDCVFAVYPNESYENETDTTVNYTGAEDVAALMALNSDDFIEGMADSRAYLDVESTGMTGKGVTVGIIDTGIDYNHPDLADTFATVLPNGNKPAEDELLNGKFVGRNYIDNGNGSNDPMDDHGHGTHVAGTIGARDVNTTGISAKGIAPEATLVSYKALDSRNSCYLNDIVAAMEDAVEDGCEIISMSLGWSSANNATHGTTLALNSLALQNPDVLFVVCAGNNGSDSYTVWSPGTSPLALTVANSRIPSKNRMLTVNQDGKESQIRLIRSGWSNEVVEEGEKYTINALSENEDGNYQMVLLPTVDGTGLGTGTEEEFAAFLNANADNDYTGTLFVVKRGQAFDDSVARIMEKLGAGAVLVINTEERQSDFESISWWQGYFFDYLPVFTIQYEEGQKLIDGLNVGENYSFYFSGAEDLYSSAAADIGCYPSGDTSVGPVTETYDLKPDLAAPGTTIVSTVYKDYYGETESYANAYAVMNGTSMATPHVSAIAALLKQKNPDLTALEMKSLLVNTADSDAFADSISRYAVGAGMVDPKAALAAMDDMVTMVTTNVHGYNNNNIEVEVSTPTISLEPVEAGKAAVRTAEVTVVNAGNASHTYQISLDNQTHALPNASTSARAAGNIFSVSENTITVAANSSATFTLTANIPTSAEGGSYETSVVLTEGDTELISPAGVYVVQFDEISDESVDHEYTFIHNAVLSNGENMQLSNYGWHGSDRTIYQFRFKDDSIETWQPLLYTYDGELVGAIDGWYKDSWGAWDWYYWDTMVAYYAPCEMDADGNLTPEFNYNNRIAIPEGAYKIALHLTKTGVDPKIVEIADLYIDNTLPQIEAGTDSKWEGTLEDDNIVLKGTITDEGTTEMMNLGINSTVDQRVFGNNTSQKDNVVIVEADEKYYRAEIAEDGSFEVEVPASLSGETVTVYYGDHFLPIGSDAKYGYFHDDFVPYDISYTVEKSVDSVPYMTHYGYRAANMDTFETVLSYKEESDNSGSTNKPTDTDKPADNTSNGSSVDTGDHAPIVMYVILMSAAMLTIVAVTVFMKKRRTSK